MSNTIPLKTHADDFRDTEFHYSVSSRMIRPDIDIIDYLKIFYMYCDINCIDHVFGSTTTFSKLYGGRKFHIRNGLTASHLRQIKTKNIGLALTLTNHFYSDAAYRESLPLLEKHHDRRNAIICTNDELAVRIKKDFPLYELKASIIKNLDRLGKVKQALDIYDAVTLPMDKNDDDDFLNALPEKNRIILFANATCAYTCPSRTCYLGFSEKISGRKITARCSKKKTSRLDIGPVFFDVKKFKRMGFNRFKLVPLAPPDAQEVARSFSDKKGYFYKSLKQSKAVFYIRSYPKCGRTWLRFIIANYLNLHFRLSMEIDLYSFFSLLPNDHPGNVRGINAYDKFCDDPRLPLILSSHSVHTGDPDQSLPAIFVFRSIPDVVVSDYFQMSRGLNAYQEDLKSYIRDPEGGVVRYCRFINSWVPRLRSMKSKIITYEMLHRDPEGTITDVLSFLDIPVNTRNLKKAVSLSQFETMKQIEKQKGFPFFEKRLHNPEARRMRKGIVGGSMENLDTSDLNHIYQTCDMLLSLESKAVLDEHHIGMSIQCQ